MLSKYVPDDYVGSDAEYIRNVYLTDGRRVVHRGRLNRVSGCYYAIKNLSGDVENAYAATTIIDEIDYSALPEEHPYHRSHEGSGHEPDSWPLIRWYSSKRGILLHHTILHDGTSIKGCAQKLLSTPPDDATHRDVQIAVSDWPHAPRVPHPDEDNAFDDCETALAHSIQFEVEAAAHNWEQLYNELDTCWIADETKIIGETEDGQLYGGEIDRLTGVEDGFPVRDVYVFDYKVSDDWHPRQLVQAEAYRRTLQDDMPGIEAAVVRLGVKKDDYEVVTSNDDRWLPDTLWDMFKDRAESLYDDNLHKIALRNSGR
jgi:hypothetical protein